VPELPRNLDMASSIVKRVMTWQRPMGWRALRGDGRRRIGDGSAAVVPAAACISVASTSDMRPSRCSAGSPFPLGPAFPVCSAKLQHL
jgi:hypothetical protein